MRLTLVRHGQPAWAVDGKGENDPNLTELGTRQAAALVEAFDGPPDLLLVSTMQRAEETVAPLEDLWDLEAIRQDWLREIHVPESWHGAPVEWVEDQFKHARSRQPEDWWDGLPGGESFRDFHQRVVGGLEGTLAGLGIQPASHEQLWTVDDHELHVVMVAHNGTNSTILARLLNIAPVPWEWDRFAMSHASLTTIATAPVGTERVFSLRRHSDVRHLAGVDVTF